MGRLLISKDDLYEEHKKLIYKLIHQYKREGYADYSDLESLSNEVFTKCIDKWDPVKGKFTTLLYTSLTNAFRTELNKAKRRLHDQEEIAQYNSRLVYDNTETSTEWLMEFLRSIDESTRQVVVKLLSMEVEGVSKTPQRMNKVRDAVMKRMAKHPDFTEASIKRSFRSIKEALRA